ncbi:hypothetical protein LXL04_021227 [Taraxacum kok-saghyz]
MVDVPIPQESRSVRILRQEVRRNQLFCSIFFYIKVLVYVRQLNLKLIYKNAYQLFDEMQSRINKLNVVLMYSYTMVEEEDEEVTSFTSDGAKVR